MTVLITTNSKFSKLIYQTATLYKNHNSYDSNRLVSIIRNGSYHRVNIDSAIKQHLEDNLCLNDYKFRHVLNMVQVASTEVASTEYVDIVVEDSAENITEIVKIIHLIKDYLTELPLP